MNAPPEPYSVLPGRLREGKGRIDIEGLGFRYGEQLHFLYQGFDLAVEPGRMVALTGPSGSALYEAIWCRGDPQVAAGLLSFQIDALTMVPFDKRAYE